MSQKQAQDKVVAHPGTGSNGEQKQAQDNAVAHHPGTGSVATTLELAGKGHGTWPI